MSLLDHNSTFPTDVMFCEIAKHRCSEGGISAKLGLCDDPVKLRVGFICFACDKTWDVGLVSDLKPAKFNPPLREHIRTMASRYKLLRIIRMGGYLMVEDGKYIL